MFNSKKGNCSHHFDNTLPMVNDAANGVPQITSTPYNLRHGQISKRSSVLLSPKNSKLLSPRRYSLSEINSPTNKSNLRIQEPHSPGPLLASLTFKDNVSMYEETKSSGLARRIVLYNEEAEQKRQSTHQEKYHSPGLFPVVHLFKKKPSHLEPSSRGGKIKLSSPDYLKSYLPQNKRKLLDGLARPIPQNHHHLSSYRLKSNDATTKNVLDALKEISRKRIHSNEECDLNAESGKRIRTQLHNGTTTTPKRNRADSPLLNSSDSPSPKQTQKKFCVYDEFAASMSSTDFSFLNKITPGTSKLKTRSTLTESPKETKVVKSINAETQTILINPENKSNLVNDSDDQRLKNKDSLLKVFDDAPLNRIRKTRLAALMGNLAGKDAALLPKPTSEVNLPNEAKEFNNEKSVETTKESETIIVPSPLTTTNENREEMDLANKALISILSPNKTTKELSPVRSDKHVHFIIPGTTSSSSINENFLLTQTSASVVSPIISASIGNSSATENIQSSSTATSAKFDIKSLNTPNLTSYSLREDESSGKNESLTTPSSTSHLFGNLDSNTRTLGRRNSSPSSSMSTSLQTGQQDMFTVPTSEAPNIPSPQKLGGFKFELKTPSTATYNPTFSNSSINTTSTAISHKEPSTTTFTFGNPNDPKKDTISFGAANNSAISKPTFSFGGDVPKSQPLMGSTTEKLPLLNSAVSAAFNFGSNVGPSTFTTSESSNYGSQILNREPTLFNISSNSPVATTTSAMLATTTVTYSSGFDSISSNFVTNSTATTPRPVPGNSHGSVLPGFGTSAVTTTNAFLLPIATTSTPTLVTSTPIFGTTSISKSVFGTNTPVTSTPIFGTTSTPTSGYGIVAVTSPSVFGNKNLSNSSGFGIVAPTKPSVFGTNNSTFGSNLTTATTTFGSNTTTSAFGSPNPSSAFGSTNTTSAFGSANTTSGFGSSSFFDTTKTQVPTFGSNSTQPKPVLGSSTATPKAFGTNTFGSTTTDTSTTTAPPAFGASMQSSSFSFGSSKPKTNAFGQVPTTNSNTFLPTSRFDPSAGFGNNTPAFGSPVMSSSSFGTTSSQAFSQVENKPAFAFGGSGETKPNSVFGSGTDNLAFGKPLNTQMGFGNSTGEIGSTSTSGFSSQANGGFNFGTNAATPSQAPFAFGAPSGSAEPAKPTFNFTGGASSPPSFGSNSNIASFGSLNSSFGSSTFGAATGPSSTGVFNIGAGSNTGRTRTQLRAKRRT